MSSLVIMIIFIISILLAIPVSISLGIASVLPGAFDPSFTASGQFVIRSMVGGIDSFPLIAVPMFVLSGIIMARGGISEKIFDVFSLLLEISRRNPLLSCVYLHVFRGNLRIGPGNSRGSRQHDHTRAHSSWI